MWCPDIYDGTIRLGNQPDGQRLNLSEGLVDEVLFFGEYKAIINDPW